MLKNKKLVIDILFIICIMIYLYSSFAKSIFLPKEIIDLENRYANKYEKLGLDFFMKGEMQDNIEETLSDQIILSSTLKKANNFIKANIVKTGLDYVFSGTNKNYINVSNVDFYGSNLVYRYANLESKKIEIDTKLKNYNDLIKKNKNIDFYLYYIEKDTDINFDTNEKVGVYEYIKTLFKGKGISNFSINNFDDFSKYFYASDHHWNYVGSYKAYEEVLDLLKVNTEKNVGQKKCLNQKFSGSKATTSIFYKIVNDDFCAYEFDFIDMDITINGENKDYGMQDEYLNKNEKNVSYGSFYGGDDGEIIFNTNDKSKENILIFGESYDNAILKLIAEKFNITISIDLRTYEREMNKEFSFDDYVKKYNIDKVLFIGNMDFYTLSNFLIN